MLQLLSVKQWCLLRKKTIYRQWETRGPTRNQARGLGSISIEVTAQVTGEMSSLCGKKEKQSPGHGLKDTHEEGERPAEETSQEKSEFLQQG